MKQKRIGLISLLVGALLLSSGIAAASEHEDTAFNYGYDEANRFLVINTSQFDVSAPDAACQLDEDEDPEDDAGTEHDVSYASFDPIEVEDLTDADGTTCDLQAAEVSGPNGQVNHGMIMKAFKTLYDGPRRGCVNRYLAQSDLGKDDQQVQAGEEASTFVPLTSLSTVEFFTALADCERGDDEIESEIEGQGNGNGKGKGRPDSPGKSGSAPGRDR